MSYGRGKAGGKIKNEVYQGGMGSMGGGEVQDYNSRASQLFQGDGELPGGFDTTTNQDLDSSTSNNNNSNYQNKGAIQGRTITPVTIRQLYNARRSYEDSFKIDDKELFHITVVGQIMKSTVMEPSIDLEVDDGTGRISVNMYNALESDNVEEVLDELRDRYRLGRYIKVVGRLQYASDKQSVSAYKIILLEDYNEITYHLLECIYVHLYNTRGSISNNGLNSVVPSQTQDVVGSYAQKVLDILEEAKQKVGNRTGWPGLPLEEIARKTNLSKDNVLAAISVLDMEHKAWQTNPNFYHS